MLAAHAIADQARDAQGDQYQRLIQTSRFLEKAILYKLDFGAMTEGL
jgi:hypothetical protein